MSNAPGGGGGRIPPSVPGAEPARLSAVPPIRGTASSAPGGLPRERPLAGPELASPAALPSSWDQGFPAVPPPEASVRPETPTDPGAVHAAQETRWQVELRGLSILCQVVYRADPFLALDASAQIGARRAAYTGSDDPVHLKALAFLEAFEAGERDRNPAAFRERFKSLFVF